MDLAVSGLVTPVWRDAGDRARPSVGRIALFVPALVGGGAEQVMLTLAEGFLERGHPVDLVVVRSFGELHSRVPRGVRLVELGSRRVVHSVPALIRYLRRRRPSALLSTLNTANIVAVLAARAAGSDTRVVIRQAIHLSRNFDASSRALAVLEGLFVRWCYPWADAVVAVSRGVADDLSGSLNIPRARVHVVPNPIVTPALTDLARRPVEHPWFDPREPPVVVGVGRLVPQKGFDVLIRAFSRVRGTLDSRLMILGEGDQRSELQNLIEKLGLTEAVSLAGFVENPLPYMSRAKLFVLSSAFEGLPGALIQALACGTAIVATDCDSGPREILQDGRLGRLVPVGDEVALADAIRAALCEPRVPLPAGAYHQYTDAASIDAYLAIMRGDHGG